MLSSGGSDEGEIIESDTEKATTSLPIVRGNSVDRQSRTKVSSTRAIDEPPDSFRYPDRSLYDDHPLRGEKRHRDNGYSHDRDRSDSRRFKVHYETGSREDRRARVSYADIDHVGDSDSHGPYDDRDNVGRDRKRPRTRSRSPAYRGRDEGRGRGRREYDNRDGQPSRSGNERLGKPHRHGKEQSVSERGNVPVSDEPSKRRAETKIKASQQDPLNLNGDSKTISPPDDEPKSEEQFVEVQAVDEAALIEERRRRREAIKAKYRQAAPNTPLLVQALQLEDTSAAPSPKTVSGDPSIPLQGSSGVSSIQTPKDTSGPGSPTIFDISKDEDLASGVREGLGGDPDEPNAADYDPTMDMREDRERDDQRHNDELSSGAYDETKAASKGAPTTTNGADQTLKPKKAKDEFDMFADDDDDMFAEQSSQPGDSSLATGEKTVPIAQGKQLDMSMLDDWDDHEGYYRVMLGELLDGRYHVQANLGKGMFSSVVRAMDSKSKKLVAIKLIRSNETMRKAGLKEIEILRKLADADPEDKKHMIRLERHFDHKGHLCMVFENLSINLREVLKKFGRDVGINLRAVRAYAHQMFLGLSLLRKCNILHADLKPDNVLVDGSRTLLKICDLGSASDSRDNDNEPTPYLVSRFYRAPEIILGVPYDFAIDVWSVGCTLYELYTGKILFAGRTNNQMLRSIMETRGRFPAKLLRKAAFAPLHFDDSLLNFRSVETDRLSGKDVVRWLTFKNPARDLKQRLLLPAQSASAGGKAGDEAQPEARDLALFVDLLGKCLELNPEKRCTPAEALRHPFLARGKVL